MTEVENFNEIESEMFESETEEFRHCRKRKTRRGKRKYRNKKGVLKITDDDFLDLCDQCEMLSSFESNSTLKIHGQRCVRKVSKLAPVLRPRYSPKAPQNSTQFLMDDHFGHSHSCEYLSFDSPDPFGERQQFDMYSPENSDLFTDMDFKYSEGKQDTSTRKSVIDQEDTIAFMEQDFERAYTSIKTEQLENMSKTDLVNVLSKMEEKADALEKELEQIHESAKCYSNVKCKIPQSSSLIDQLRTENINLEEENKLLKRLIYERKQNSG